MTNLKPKYAPGPYRVDHETPNHAPIITAEDGKGRDLAEIRGDSKEERAATANLLAAAPELLTWSKELLAWDDDPPPVGTRGKEIYDALAAAIAKAEGRS